MNVEYIFFFIELVLFFKRLDVEINNLIAVLNGLLPEDDEYKTVSQNLETLCKIRKEFMTAQKNEAEARTAEKKADAAISEPLPPKHEPTDNAHHTGIIASLPPRLSSMVFKSGIMVATKGILSIAVDRMADDHKTK